MTRTTIALLLLAVAGPAWGQDTTIIIRQSRPAGYQRLATRELPRDVADQVVQLFNSESTVRFSGSTRIPVARGIDGDVAILGGPVVVGGRISGTLLVVNGDVQFESGAVVGGDVLVVGGTIQGTSRARISGEIRAYRDPLRYRRQGDRLVYAPAGRIQPPRWIRQQDWREERGSETGILLALGGTYNRVEGLPILFGPRADLRLADQTRLQADALAIVRTTDISFDNGDIGYRAHAELVFGGQDSNFGLGIHGYDMDVPVEPWPLKDREVGWASFLLHRDYRDYYRRQGGSVYATLRLTRAFSLTAEGRDERELSLQTRNPWTLFRPDDVWRPNPAITDGRYRSAVGSFRFDTRNDLGTPSAGWFVTGEYELGQGRDITGQLDPMVCLAFAGPCLDPALADGKLDYQRVAFDARSYLRLSPAGRLNLRLAGGGWVGGEPLPLQRRVSLGYPDPLPGYGFRQFSCGGTGLAGEPAMCDRALVAQAEFRTHLGFDFGPEWASDWGDSGDEHYEPFHVSGPDLVVFADAGSAWKVDRHGSCNPTCPAGVIPSDKLPAPSSFKTDIGIGLDFGPLGFYLAKPLDTADRAVTFTVRMGRRF
jgi:hypothetical protein